MRSLLPLLVLLLALPLGLSSALPMAARAMAGAQAHVCHCAVRGVSTCGCPICNPDLDVDLSSDPVVRGACGDDDEAFGAALGAALPPPAGWTLAPAPVAVAVTARATSLAPAAPVLEPPTPPPRAGAC